MKKLLFLSAILSLIFFFHSDSAKAAVFFDVQTGLTNANGTKVSGSGAEAGQTLIVGAADIQLASVQWICNPSGDDCSGFILLEDSDHNPLVYANDAYFVATKTYQSDFTTLPVLKAGTTYYIVRYNDSSSFDWYKKTAVATPVVNPYFRLDVTADGVSNQINSFNKLTIIPKDEVTVSPDDWFKDYFNFSTQLTIISTAIIAFLIIVFLISSLIKQ